MRLRTLLASLGALLALTACAAPAAPEPRAALDPARHVIFHNGVVLTMDTEQPVAQALAVRGEMIEAVGADADVLAARAAGSVVIDLGGRTLLPGFVDAHTHVLNDARSQGLSLDQAQALALRNGITTLGDLFVDEAFLREMEAFERAGSLRVRTSLYLVHNDPCGRNRGTWWKNFPPTRAPGEWLRIGGVKIFTDGGSCGGVALSFDHNEQHGGDLWLEQAELDATVAEVQAAGHQAAIHAIGDRAVAQAQASIAAALNGQPNRYRHRLEHVSVLTPEMVARFGELGVVPVVPGQYPSCTPFGPPLPEAYGAWEWPWRDLRERNPGLNIAWHSDYPFWSINPMVHLYGFVTRRDVYSGYHTCAPKPWLTDDTLTVPEALSIMTLQSAYALFRESEVGSLAPGKYADLIILSGNPLTVAPDELRRLNVLATLVGGQFEHCAVSAAPLCPGYTVRALAPLPDRRPPVAVAWAVAGLAALLPLGLLAWSRPGRAAARLVGGVAAVAGGSLWALAWWPPPDDVLESGWRAIVAAALLAAGVAALRTLGPRSRLALVGGVVAALGAVSVAEGVLAMAWLNLDAGWLGLVLGVMGHGVGLALLAWANFRPGGRRSVGALALAMALLGCAAPFVASSLVPEFSPWPVWLLGLGLGAGWVALGGLAIFESKRPPMTKSLEVAGGMT